MGPLWKGTDTAGALCWERPIVFHRLRDCSSHLSVPAVLNLKCKFLTLRLPAELGFLNQQTGHPYFIQHSYLVLWCVQFVLLHDNHPAATDVLIAAEPNCQWFAESLEFCQILELVSWVASDWWNHAILGLDSKW